MSRILTSIHGNLLGIDDTKRIVVPNGMRHGPNGNQFDAESPRTCVLRDDFTGAAISAANFGLNKGSDAGAVLFAVLAGEPDGAVRGVTGAGAGATMAVNGIEMTSSLAWKANSGSLVYDARIRLSAITNIQVFVGFTNALASTLQAPITGSGTANGLTYNAADAVGFLFDTAMTTATLWGVGVKATVGATPINSGVVPVAGTWIQLRIEVDKLGNAKYFINGKSVGNAIQAAAVTATVALTPVVEAFTRTVMSANIDVDYIYAGADRV